ncbi:MAG: hypothetical protein GXY41_08950 [Phycisphaerae bacterium]|nr:hypothetical protein [Phycisphaerae bacterium]
MQTQDLPLSQLRIDGGTQPRVAINEEAVSDYAERLRESVVLPPVAAFFDGVVYWLADGFHRYHAHRRAGREAIAVDVHDGGLREAILYSVGANTEHGLRRTHEDKRKAVETLLTHEIASRDENGNPWSDSDIARQCHVHHTTVGRIRKDHTCAMHKYENEKRAFTHPKTGKPTVMNTAKIGRSFPKRATSKGSPSRPDASGDCLTIDIPRHPKSAARTLLSLFGKTVATEIAEHVLLIVNDPQAAQSQG